VRQAAELGFEWLELTNWFSEDGADIAALEEKKEEARWISSETGVGYSALALYGNSFAADLATTVDVFERAFQLARYLHCYVITAMTGRDPAQSIDENMPLLEHRWSRLAELAEDYGVKIAFEPWPGSMSAYGPNDWVNCAVSPELWDRLFDAVPSEALGLEYDPSHLLWQQIDYLKAFRDYSDRIYHVHAKDTAIDREKLARCGVHVTGWWRFTIPGEGDVDWKGLFDTFRTAGYDGPVVIEHEDANYSGGRFTEGLIKARDFLRPYL